MKQTLERLNALLALVHPQQGALHGLLRTALERAFEANEQSGEVLNDVGAGIEMLRRLYSDGAPPAFAHTDIGGEGWGPLWIGEKIRDAMRPLAGYPDALLVVSGLGLRVRPESGRWSRVGKGDYDAMRALVDETARRYVTKNARLRIFYI